MNEQEHSTLPPRCELKPGEEIDGSHIYAPERAQVADDRWWRRGGHLKIDRPAGEKSSARRPMNSGAKPGLSSRCRSRTT
jgi:hypothetical protein